MRIAPFSSLSIFWFLLPLLYRSCFIFPLKPYDHISMVPLVIEKILLQNSFPRFPLLPSSIFAPNIIFSYLYHLLLYLCYPFIFLFSSYIHVIPLYPLYLLGLDFCIIVCLLLLVIRSMIFNYLYIPFMPVYKADPFIPF